ncbi:tachylectin-related carbohydrate-binding protein [Kribbella sp. NPDC051770]|uniref:tachylectin-related carbohydrate-binding protein n=1 Tax=Kribbella sp. NPDC051770 TaxID=3155413 RepID=UPI003424B657
MHTSVPTRLPRSSVRRTLGAALLTAGLTLGSLSVPGAPANAATTDADISCTPTQNVFSVNPDGELVLNSFNDLSSAASPILAAPAKVIGGGWQQFGKLLAGPNGWLYGINATGMFGYHWNGTAFDVVAKPFGKIFSGWAAAGLRDKITIDARGHFYLIQSNGDLRRYVLDAATSTFSSQPVGGGWNIFSSITGAGDGVIYARTPAGGLNRYQFEPTSDRFVHAISLSNSNWAFPIVTSPGGDVLLGLDAAGRLSQHRYKRDPGSWVVSNRTVGTGWQVYSQVVATTNACTLTASYVPQPPAVPTELNPPMAVLQTPAGAIEYGLANNIGEVKWGHQSDPIDFGGTAWNAMNDGQAFTGTPGLVQGADGRIEFMLHNVNSRFAARTQTAAGSTELGPLVDRGGVMASSAVSAKSPANNKMVSFAVDGDGKLWGKPEQTQGFFPWQPYASPPLSGVPVIAPGPNNTLTVIARDTAGTFWAASWNGGGLSAFSSLGGTGFTGKVSAVRYPGDLIRVFARDADGRIKTQKQTAAGTAFPGTWTTVGPEDMTWPGSPAAVMAPDSGLLEVLVRGTDGKYYFAQELTQGSGTWPTFKPINLPESEQYSVDATPFVYTAQGEQKWAFATYNQNFAPRVITASAAPTSAKIAKTTAAGDPTFTLHKLPTP